MIATRFSTVGWAGCICAAALSFYLVSQTVAAKRAELSTVDRKIQSTQREIAQLETEISTRGGMAQIENWNSKVYGLQAPGAAQFVNSSVQLVAMADPQPLPLDPSISPPHGPVQQVSLTVPAAPPAQAAPDKPAAAVPVPVQQPALRQATYVQPRPMAMALGAATLQKTSYETLSDDTLDTEKPIPAKPVAAKSAAENPATHKTADTKKAETKAPVEKKPNVSKVAEAKPARDVAKAALAKLDDARAAKKSTPKTVTRMTALDDHWLAEATAEPKGKRSHKERP